MANPYLVIRLVPDSPIDGATFSTYLNDLQIDVYQANTTPPLTKHLGGTPWHAVPVVLAPIPETNDYMGTTSLPTSSDTAFVSNNDFGKTLNFENTLGIPVDSFLFNVTSQNFFSSSALKVTSVNGTTVTLDGAIQNLVPKGTVCSFIYDFTGWSNNTTTMSKNIAISAKANNGDSMLSLSGSGLFFGISVSGPGIAANTTVTAVDEGSVTLSNPITSDLAKNTNITFTFNLPAGIAQEFDPVTFNIFGWTLSVAYIPASVATAIIPLTGLPTPLPSPPPLLNITVQAQRNLGSGPQNIPIANDFYNVQYQTDNPPSPDQFQYIPNTETALYITVPPPPNPGAISLAIPSDGTAPNFDDLIKAMTLALASDTSFPAETTLDKLTANDCVRMAYDIVWSQQSNMLPPPPDTLESLYTNPPNPGGSSGNGSTNNLEQDRQKFEGTVSSFYATRNATAERLTKFVAAASAALFCEKTSLNSKSALLEFPVDPASTFAASVESELLLEGLGANGVSGLIFGVPAAFFYAIGASLDKSTTASQRFQLATGDAIERLFQLFSAAEKAGSIADPEDFKTQGVTLGNITSFQAARRLAALGVSAASNSPSVQVYAGTPLAKLVADWLSQTDPTPTPAPNPPPTYQDNDFIIWSQTLSASDPTGYLFLDLDTLTQGYIIAPFMYSPSSAALSGLTTLQFQGVGLGIAPKMPVTGTNIAPDTVVTKIDTITTVTLSSPGISVGGVTTATVITFSSAGSPLTASPSVNAATGITLIFEGTPITEGIVAGMKVSGTNIAPGTTVISSVTTTTVSLSAATTGAVATTDVLTFNAPISNVVLITSADCPSGTVLTFASTGGVDAGMSAYGINIKPGTAVDSKNATTITIHDTVQGDVPKGSLITFANLADFPSSLADQIAAWLPTTTTPPTPNPTVETLKQVTAEQWTNFFTYVGNPSWLPPFTQPVAPGASPGQVTHKAGYVAMRIRAFIRAVQQFFSVSSVATAAQLPAIGAPPLFDLPVPSNDPILEAAGYLSTISGTTFSFGTTISPTDLATAVQDVFPSDPAAQAWLMQAMIAINELFEIASVVPPVAGVTLPNPVSLPFSIAEALYARGFRRASDISRLSGPDFQQALTGTIAYDYAASLQAKAQVLAPMPTPGGPGDGGTFQPINPDGSLMNCVPPPCLSPTGPIAYLQEMLNLSQVSTCADPFASPGDGQTTLGNAVSARRGPVGNLLASCANLEMPLPTIDIVNECLEYLGTAPATVSGTVYDTSENELAGYALCNDGDCKKNDRDCHDPVVIYAALPEYSTPATPVTNNQAVEPLVYNNLKTDFSSCDLPYSQALDVSRTYQQHFGSCRFEEMRTFRKCITEFALDPSNPPAGFQSFLWRYPVLIDTAIEYLEITPEEYTMLFQGSVPQACGQQAADTSPRPAGQGAALQSFGFSPVQVREFSDIGVIPLPEFLKGTCLSYCEFVELSKSGVPITLTGTQRDGNTRDRKGVNVPECEPCCLGDYEVQFPADGRETALQLLAVFIRLWRKLKCLCGAGYTFAQLYDICSVLKLFNGSAINPEFIRQLAAFQILRDQFHLPLSDPTDETSSSTGAERTHLLALWVGSGAKKWNWAKYHLLKGIEAHARSRNGCPRECEEQINDMADNLDALSRLAGFNPGTADLWNTNPGCTLRFTEVLAKMCASEFRIGELLYLFNAEPPQDCENPFPMQDADDVLAYPLEVPEDSGHHSLWKLREELLQVEVCEDDWRCLSWTNIVNELRHHFGYVPPAGQDPLLSLGQHFFPCVLEESGFSVSAKQRQYRTALTSTTAWNSQLGSPFQYDSSTSELCVQLPLGDEAVAAKLGSLPPLNAAEQAAAQDLYFAPRLDLAFVAFLFPDWQSAEIHLIQECEERERWHWFQRNFALANARRKVIAAHLAKHVAHRTGCRAEDLHSVAGLIISRLYSDENTGTPWDSDNGVPPNVMWTSPPAGGAIPALLGLVGTGLLGEYNAPNANTDTADAGPAAQVIWRDVRGPMQAFGHERDTTNSAVPTVLPPITLSTGINPLIAVNNGYAVKTSDGHRLGGAEPILVKWSGSMLVEHEGEYRFHAGAPTPEGEKPDVELVEKSQWRVTLQRGSKVFAVLNHGWPGNTEPEVHEPRLRRGAYQITVEYSQLAPDLSTSHPHRKRTGFQVKYAGPDTEDCLVTLPIHRLYRDYQDQTLDQGIPFLPGSKNAQLFLKAFYTSTLRDMRRTYQRAFKAVLFAGKLDLSARCGEDHRSELGYMLANPSNFAGYAYYRTSPSAFTQHLVNFDFNVLPLKDNYHPPAADARTAPSLQQSQGMFDWWERLYDYTVVRKQAHRRSKVPIWHLFEEAKLNPPGDSAQLLRHIGAEHKYWDLDLRYYQDQWSAIYSVSGVDLQDDRWLVRVWHADRWIRCLMDRIHAQDISKARPDLWASDDPSAPVPASGVTQTGNANLLAFLNDACFNENPCRYTDVKRVNDGLRERGRKALISYLCNSNRVLMPWSASTYATKSADLSDLLLLDVETGVCEKASRIEEAITAVQTFIRRSRLGLEPNWIVGYEFVRLWDSRFQTYRTWERCKLRDLYRENWIEWTERDKARRIEAYRFLESELRSSTCTLAAPGGLDWWEDGVEQLEHAPTLLQKKVPSELEALTTPPQSTTREGLATIATPEYAARPTWLSTVPQVTGSTGSGSTGTAPTPPKAFPALAKAAADGGSQPVSVPLWMESAMKLGTRFLRIAAAAVPQASLEFEPYHEESRDGCCRECGCDHPVLVDEYYFWLVNTQFYQYTDQTDAQSSGDVSFSGSYQFGFQDSYYDPFQQQSAEWNEENMVPSLLAKWEPSPAVRLAWCRVHNGHFGQPRKSDDYVAIAEPADLVFLGRGGDSLYFQVTGSATLPPGYTEDTSPGGFRYDLPTDQSIGLPQAIKPPALPSPSPYPGGLLSYPFFAFHDAGARLFPGSWFSPSMAVAEALRAHCGFELALKWYQRAFDPLSSDCTWMVCDGNPDENNSNSACCDSSKVTDEVARQRAVLLHYCQTLMDWGDALMRRRRSLEAFQQARLIYDTVARITGCTPQTILLPKPVSPPSVTDFTADNPPLNPRLMDIYSLVGDRLGLIRTCYDARRLRNGRPDCDMPYWGDDPLRDGWRMTSESCADETEWCHRSSPYRFVFQIQKAHEFAGRVRELGSALLAAYEKGDAEALASIRAVQERDMLTLGISIRQDQWRDADWQVQALQQTKEVNQTNLLYYTTLYQNDLINNEIQNLSLTTNAMLTRTGANLVSATGEFFHILPDSNVGAMSSFLTLPTGKKMAFMFDTIARIMQTVADIQSTNASMDLTQAGWQRRSVEWFHQMQTLPIEIHQIELQILGAQRRRDQAMQELNNQQRQIENATEVLDFLRDKFTATDLYLFLQKETSALYRMMYELAHRAADEAQRAFNFERGHTTRRFIPEEMWENLHEGLMAGERLDFALRHMEKAYLDENVREYELTKHFSLRLQFPAEFLRLRTTGCCEIDIPEWMFDLDFPGHYMRRIKSVTLTIPCVTGPYTGVHCRLTLLSSATRIDPRLSAPPHECCCPPEPCCSECSEDERLGREYLACPDDPRIVRIYGARDAVATSSGRNDSGLFQLDFNDQRYLPFEYMGAVSRWRIELPPENNYFDMESLTDMVMQLNYMAREGGDRLRVAARASAHKKLPGNGWIYIDLRRDFPDAWELFQRSNENHEPKRCMTVKITRKLFPFLPGDPAIKINKLAVLFEKEECCEPPSPEICECPCPYDEIPGCQKVEVMVGNANHDRDDCNEVEITCVSSKDCSNLYQGVGDVRIGPIDRCHDCHSMTITFEDSCCGLARAFLLFRYEVIEECRDGVRPVSRENHT